MSGSLSHSPAKITLDLLIQAGIAERVDGTSRDWNIYLNKGVPEKTTATFDMLESKIISVYDTAAITTSRIQYTGHYHEGHGVQIMVRLNEYEEAAGYTKSKQILDYLDTQVKYQMVSISGVDYLIHSYSRTTDILRLNTVEKDDQVKGLRFSLNFLMYVTKV